MSVDIKGSEVLRHECNLVSAKDAKYADVDVLIKLQSGEEYLFTVSRDNETGLTLAEDDVRYASSLAEDFSGFIGEVPAHVAAKLAEVRPQAILLFPVLNK